MHGIKFESFASDNSTPLVLPNGIMYAQSPLFPAIGFSPPITVIYDLTFLYLTAGKIKKMALVRRIPIGIMVLSPQMIHSEVTGLMLN